MDVLSPDFPQLLKVITAMLIVLALMGGLSLLLKRLGLSAQTSLKSGGERRLKIVESLPIDARRRIVIIKCDAAEHLLVIGAEGETVVQSNIPSVDGSHNSDQNT